MSATGTTLFIMSKKYCNRGSSNYYLECFKLDGKGEVMIIIKF